ncbi:formimidoylglutamate deiminase [Mesorhizobium sp. CO1-1-11]|uniref:formimidoylglutamate deiminase n=1 Tax=Mesorhizobium sp. CO1-1-11 TaxID=2876636 RepID=UPI001CC9D0FA|nr:formimidoylglutamate deiminase [Mesorhizobium sp. CO1-1-11]MBZ9726312.1 formimidoylglutamate deiminase [Mesorhizobium sp. CO1-1-11]
MSSASLAADQPVASVKASSERLFARTALLPQGWAQDVAIDIDGDRIVSVTAGAKPAGEILDVVIPGIPNLHSHAFQRLVAGLAESRGARSDSFWSWRDFMFRVLGALDPDTLEDIYAFVFASMVEAGYTSVAEFHYVHNNPDGGSYDNDAEMSLRAVAAARTAGLPITHLPVVYCRGGFRDEPLSAHQRRLACELDRSQAIAIAVREAFKDWDSLNVGLAPHSLRAVAPSLLRPLADAVSELGPASVMHIHVSEQVQEVQECLSVHGLTPIELLSRSVDLNERWSLVHCTQAKPEELAEIARCGATVVLCPVTEANLGDGAIDLPALVQSGARFGIGSDSQASLDPWREFMLLEYSQRFRLRQRNIACDDRRSVGRFLSQDCASAGAKALGRSTGQLAPGYKADIVELRRDADPCLALLSGDQFLDAWIFAAHRSRPASVFVGGRRMVENGMHKASRALKQRYLKAVERLRGQL